MFLSLCFLLSLASYGFSGVQSRATANFPGPKDPAYYNGFVDPNKGGNWNNGVSDKVQQPSVAFFTGGIFGVMGMLPMPTPSDQSSDDYSESYRGEQSDKMKEFDEKLQSTLKALDDLEEDVKARKSKSSKRFFEYN